MAERMMIYTSRRATTLLNLRFVQMPHLHHNSGLLKAFLIKYLNAFCMGAMARTVLCKETIFTEIIIIIIIMGFSHIACQVLEAVVILNHYATTSCYLSQQRSLGHNLTR